MLLSMLYPQNNNASQGIYQGHVQDRPCFTQLPPQSQKEPTPRNKYKARTKCMNGPREWYNPSQQAPTPCPRCSHSTLTAPSNEPQRTPQDSKYPSQISPTEIPGCSPTRPNPPLLRLHPYPANAPSPVPPLNTPIQGAAWRKPPHRAGSVPAP